jgi:hypothetical protein
MKDTINNTIRRNWGYWLVDGIVELYLGGLLILISLLYFFQVTAPEGIHGFVGSAIPVIVLLAAILGGTLVQKTKKRITYPRTGYVSYPQTSWTLNMLSALLGGALGISISVLAIRLAINGMQEFLQAGVGLALAIFLAGMGLRVRSVPRLYWLAALSAMASLLQVYFWGAETGGNIFYALVMGLAFLLTGGLTLRNYLSQPYTKLEE